MDTWLNTSLTIIGSVAASSGFWAYIMKRREMNSAANRLIRGLGRREIISEGVRYLDRGWVSKDEYEEYQKYLFEPYFELGGNGLAEKIVAEVKLLPIRYKTPTTEEIQIINKE